MRMEAMRVRWLLLRTVWPRLTGARAPYHNV